MMPGLAAPTHLQPHRPHGGKRLSNEIWLGNGAKNGGILQAKTLDVDCFWMKFAWFFCMFLEDFKGDLTVVFGWFPFMFWCALMVFGGRMTRTTTLSATTTWVAMCRWIMVDRWMAGRKPEEGERPCSSQKVTRRGHTFPQGKAMGKDRFSNIPGWLSGASLLGAAVPVNYKWICFTVPNLWRWLTYHYLHYRSYSHCFHPNCTSKWFLVAALQDWLERMDEGNWLQEATCAAYVRQVPFRSSVAVLWDPLKFGSVNFCTIMEQWGQHPAM